jgi:signal transduction histidine kinase
VSLTRRLLFSYLTVIVVSVVVLTVAAERGLRSRLVDEARVMLEREARYLAEAATGLDGPRLDTVVRRLGRATGRRLTIIAADGRVIADSDFPPDQLATLEDHSDRPEVIAALEGRSGSDLRRSASSGRAELKVALPYDNLIARVSSPLPQVDAIVDRARAAVLLGAIAAILVSAVLAFGFTRSVTRPLLRLREAAQAVARGEHPALDIRGRHEVGELARALSMMVETLGRRLSELERERSEMAALIGSMVEGVIACDQKGAITAMNPAARAFLGITADEAPPPAGELFLSRAAREVVQEALQGRLAAGIETEIGSRTLLLTGHGLVEGGAVIVMHDVTDLKRLEAVRRDFVANVSHELKTPLTVVRGYAETLRQDDPPAAVRAQFLEAILANARRMQRLVDDLLDLSRIESGGWRPVPANVEIEPVAREVWFTLSAGRTGAETRLVVDTAADARTVWADPEGLRQILSNVLDNSLRHTPSGGTVTVRSMPEPSGVRLEIGDTGPGIPGEHLSRIFERFYRVDPARSRELGGTGLGLAIVKHLVEAHGGRVEALSTLGAGTTIRITLPMA